MAPKWRHWSPSRGLSAGGLLFCPAAEWLKQTKPKGRPQHSHAALAPTKLAHLKAQLSSAQLSLARLGSATLTGDCMAIMRRSPSDNTQLFPPKSRGNSRPQLPLGQSLWPLSASTFSFKSAIVAIHTFAAVAQLPPLAVVGPLKCKQRTPKSASNCNCRPLAAYKAAQICAASCCGWPASLSLRPCSLVQPAATKTPREQQAAAHTPPAKPQNWAH